jgi:hypothetical protein
MGTIEGNMMKTKCFVLISTILIVSILFGIMKSNPIIEVPNTASVNTSRRDKPVLEATTTNISNEDFEHQNQKKGDLGYEELNTERNLSNYSIKFETSKIQDIGSIPKLEIDPVQLDQMIASKMLSDIFDFPSVEASDMPWGGKSYVFSGERVEFFGMNRIYYDNLDEKPIVREWNISNVLETANNFIKNMLSYFSFESEVIYKIKYVNPCYYTTEYNPETEEETTTIHAIGVYYTLEVDGYELTGPGSDISVWIANGKVVNAEIHYPKIKKTGTMDIQYSPDQALEKFIKGETGNYFYEDLSGPIADTGECIIKSFDIIYYIDFSGSIDVQVPARYRIQGVLKYIDPIDKVPIEEEFTEYQLIS